MNKYLRSPIFVALLGFCFVIMVGLFSHAHAYPVIQEIYYDAPGSDKEDIFTEIYGDPGMSLDGWSLLGVNGTDGSIYRTIKLSGAVIPSDGLLVIATDHAADDVLLNNRDFTANVDWQNGPDAVVIRDPSNNVVDAVGYGSSEYLPFGDTR
jgi:predicted extracellular nuclease